MSVTLNSSNSSPSNFTTTSATSNLIFNSSLFSKFIAKNIKSISVTEKGAIELVYNNKKYCIGGYIDFLAQTSNPEKNKELVLLLNKKYFEKKKWFKNRV